MTRTLLASLLLVLALPQHSEPQKAFIGNSPPLKELGEVGVVVEELSPDAQEAGLSDEDLKARTIVVLKRDIPALKVRDHADASVFVTVTVLRSTGAISGHELGYIACVHVEVSRPVYILGDASALPPIIGFHVASVWDRVTLIAGARESIARQVKEGLETYLTKFAADYYGQNGR